MNVVLSFVWVSIKDTGSMYEFAAIYGLFAATMQALFPPTMADLNTDPRKTETRFGMGFALSSFGVFVGCPVGGALIELGNGSYLYAQLFAGSCGILGFFCVLLAACIDHKKMKQCTSM
jgi:MFS family permease